MSLRLKAVLFSLVHLIAAAAVYRYLITFGAKHAGGRIELSSRLWLISFSL